MTHLSYLGLDHNGITSLSENLKPLLMGLQYLSLEDNHFHCNCELRWLKRWLSGNDGAGVIRGESILCVTPSAKPIMNMEDEYFTCSEPAIVHISRSLNVSEENEVALDCMGEGDPAPTIVWSSPNGEVASTPPKHSRTETENQGFFHIKSASLDDRGTYTCTAVNLAGNNSIKLYMNVYKSDNAMQGALNKAGVRHSCPQLLPGVLAATAYLFFRHHL
jgi:hypothetical protein